MTGDHWLSLFTIYQRPRDYPLSFVVREYRIGVGSVVASEVVAVADTLSAARAALTTDRPNLVRIPRQAGDDPVIVETWV